MWLTYLSVVSKMGGSLLGRLIRGLWEIACSWALIFSACLRSFLALRMAGTPLRSRWAAFLCHSSYLGYLLGFLETSYCGVQAKVGSGGGWGGERREGSEFTSTDKTHSTRVYFYYIGGGKRETSCLFSTKHLLSCRGGEAGVEGGGGVGGRSQMEMKPERHNRRASPATGPCFGFRG